MTYRTTGVNLQNLINRIEMFRRFIEQAPERKEHFEERIKETE